MLPLTRNAQLHKGLEITLQKGMEIIPCHVCIYSHLKGKTTFSPSVHQSKTNLQWSRREYALLGTPLQHDCSIGSCFFCLFVCCYWEPVLLHCK